MDLYVLLERVVSAIADLRNLNITHIQDQSVEIDRKTIT